MSSELVIDQSNTQSSSSHDTNHQNNDGVITDTSSSTTSFSVQNQFVNSNVRVTDQFCDSNGTYYVYHFINCDEKSDPEHIQTRGVIRFSADHNPNNGVVVCKTFDFTPEFFSSQKDDIIVHINNLVGVRCDTLNFYDAEESTLIRLWHHNNKWRISTHKRFNAYESYWSSSTSHGELFEQAIIYQAKNGSLKDEFKTENDNEILDVYYNLLDTNKIYTFSVRTNENNRIVCVPEDHPTIYFAGEFDSKTFNLLTTNTSFISRPASHSFQQMIEVFEYLSNLDQFKKQGLMVYHFNSNNNTSAVIKLTSEKYRQYADVRNNVMSLTTRYYQIRKNADVLTKFLVLYPYMNNLIDMIENVLTIIINNILSKYMARFVRRNADGTRDFVTLPPEQWYVAKQLHELYLQDNQRYRISQQLVRNFIDNMEPQYVENLVVKEMQRAQSYINIQMQSLYNLVTVDNQNVTQEEQKEQENTNNQTTTEITTQTTTDQSSK